MEAKQQFKGVSWDASDLISCKQAVGILAGMGVGEEELLTLDFGSLDVLGVIEEAGLSAF
jgi:hypothetical protein